MSAVAASPSRLEVGGQSSGEKYLRTVATYIPSEAVALYLFVLGLLTSFTNSADNLTILRWICFAIGVVAAVGLVFLTFKPGEADTAAGVARRKRAQLIGFSLVAFIAYSIATPGGPFIGTALGLSLTTWGAVVVAILAVFMPIVAQKWGLRPGQ